MKKSKPSSGDQQMSLFTAHREEPEKQENTSTLEAEASPLPVYTGPLPESEDALREDSPASTSTEGANAGFAASPVHVPPASPREQRKARSSFHVEGGEKSLSTQGWRGPQPSERTSPMPTAAKATESASRRTARGSSRKPSPLEELRAISERLRHKSGDRVPPAPPAPSNRGRVSSSPVPPAEGTRASRSSRNTEDALTVRELYNLVKPTLKKLGSVRIRGEVSNRKIPGSGHLYFSLKDRDCVVNMAFFRKYHRPQQFLPKDGVEVVCRGEVTVYESRSGFQMIVHEIEPVGRGALFEAFERLKGRLQYEGLFAMERKQQIPPFPRRVGVVTSPTGAALQDILKVFRHRAPSISLLLAGTQVQGEGAAPKVAAAIEALNRQGDLDLIIVGRGGGSIEDLWTFNEEVVVRAIAASRIPIISGVGHQTDNTLSDLAADLRAATPSAAAELASSSTDDDILSRLRYFEERLEDSIKAQQSARRLSLSELNHRLDSPKSTILKSKHRNERLLAALRDAFKTRLSSLREEWWALEKRLEKRNPENTLRELRARWEHATSRLESSGRVRVEASRRELARMAGRLDDLSPLNVLKRGYSLTTDEQGTVIQSTDQVHAGASLTVKLRTGSLRVEVREKLPGEDSSGPEK